MKYRLLRFSLLSVLVMLCGGFVHATDPVTAKWDFTSDANPRAATFLQGTSGTLESNVDGVVLSIDANNGKFDSQNRTSDAQVTNGTIVKVPVVSTNDQVTIVGNWKVSYTIGSEAEAVTDLNKTYTATAADVKDGFVTITVTDDNNYFYSIQVVQNEPEEEPEGAVILYSWNQGTETGGQAVASDGESVNYANATYTTIRLNGKADFSTNVVTTTLDKPLKAGDKIKITGYRNKNDKNKQTGFKAKFDKGGEIATTDGLYYVNIDTSDESAEDSNRGTEPNTEEFEVPAAAAGSTSITMTRAFTNTNLFITKLVIETTEGGEEPVAQDVTGTWDYSNADVMTATMALSGSSEAGQVNAQEDNGLQLTVLANGAAFRNNGNNIQVRKDAEFRIPVKNAGDLVTIKGYPGYSYYSINDGEEVTNTNDNPQTEYKAKASDAERGYVSVVSTNDNNYYLSLSVTQYAPKDPSQPELVEKSIYKTDFSEWEELTSSKEESIVAKTTKFTNEELNFTFYNTGVNTGTYDESKFPNNNGYRIFCEKNAGGYVVTSALANISKVRFVHAATGGSRGYKLEAKGEGDEDWVVISNSYANPNGWCEVTANVNKENCQLRFTNLAEAQYAYLFELEIFGKVDLSNEPMLETLTANGKTYNADDIFEMESDGNYHATIELASNETMVDASNPVTAVAANGEIGEITYEVLGMANLVTIPVTVKEKTVNYVAAFVRKPMLTLTYVGVDGQEIGTQQVEKDAPLGEFAYDINSVAATKGGYKARGWFKQNYVGEKYTTASTFAENAKLYAVETEIEVSSESRKYEFDLTDKNFDPADHEAFNPTGGAWHDTTHGWSFSNGNTIDLLVGTKATISITTCKYPEGGTTKIVASNGVEVSAIGATDGAGQNIDYEGEAGTLTLTISGGQCYIHKLVINNTAETSYTKDGDWLFVKANDAVSLTDALEIANGTADQRQYVFIPNGTYDLGTKALTTIAGSNVSIIGESMEGVIIKNRPVKEGIAITATLLNTGSNNYLQDLTLDCIAPYGTGDDTNSAERGVTLQDKGNQTICKNVYLKGLQDTYYSNNNNGTYYFEDGKIEGTVDYVCGYGDVYFNKVLFYNATRSNGSGGDCIAAPNTLKSFGYIFSDCTIDGTEVNANNYRLARPWAANTIVKMINTTMIIKPVAEGWGEWSPAKAVTQFAEYNSVDAEGAAIDLSGRKTTIGGQANTPILTADEAATCTVNAIFSGDWKPAQLAAQLEAPDAEYTNGTVTWAPTNNGAIAYMIEKNGEFVGITAGNSMTVEADAEKDKLTIRAANGRGGFGEAKQVAYTATSIQAINAAIERGEQVIYNLAGQRVNKATKGMYIINGQKIVVK